MGKRTVSREDTLFGADRALYSIDTCEKALPRDPGTLSFTIPSPIVHLSNLPLTFAAALAEVDINHPGWGFSCGPAFFQLLSQPKLFTQWTPPMWVEGSSLGLGAHPFPQPEKWRSKGNASHLEINSLGRNNLEALGLIDKFKIRIYCSCLYNSVIPAGEYTWAIFLRNQKNLIWTHFSDVWVKDKMVCHCLQGHTCFW